MTNERIFDILSKAQDYFGPLYKSPDGSGAEPLKLFNVKEVTIIDVFDIGTDSAVVLWKRKGENMLRHLAMVSLIVNGRVQLSMQAREYMRANNIRIENGDHRLNVPASAAGYLLYLASIGTGYRLLDNEFDENHIERYTRGEILDIIEDAEGYRGRIYSICPIGGTGTIAVEYSVKKEEFIPGKPRAKFAIISDNKIVVSHILPTNKFSIPYTTPTGEKRYLKNASNYADMWLSYGAANKNNMQQYIDNAVEVAYDSETVKVDTVENTEDSKEDYTPEYVGEEN